LEFVLREIAKKNVCVVNEQNISKWCGCDTAVSQLQKLFDDYICYDFDIAIYIVPYFIRLPAWHVAGESNLHMSWIYLFRQHNTQLVVMVFYNDVFRLTRVIVRLCSEPFGFSTVVTYSSGGCWLV
jgi:hypothetical protein